MRSMNQLILHHIGRSAGEIAEKRQAADFFHVPEKLNSLQAHGGHSSRGSDDQYRSTRSRAVGDELPQKTVGWVLREAIHPHGSRNQRHVVHDGAYEAE